MKRHVPAQWVWRLRAGLAAGLVAVIWAVPADAGLGTPLPTEPLGQITEFPLPERDLEHRARPYEITPGPDGNLWFTEWSGRIARITTSGEVTEFEYPGYSRNIEGIVTGSDGNLWFTQRYVSEIGRITPGGEITAFPLPSNQSEPTGITAGPDGNVWFTEGWGNRIGRITPSGEITEFTIPTPESRPERITTAPDGNLWFTENYENKIGRITPDGDITEFTVPTEEARPWGIGAAPDGNVWFTESLRDNIGRITPEGEFTEFPLSHTFAIPGDMAPGPYGEMWFTEKYNNTIDRVAPNGRIERFQIETVVPEPPWGVYSSSPTSIVLGPDGYMWFTEEYSDKIGRISPGLPVPENVELPKIEGEADAGEALKVTTGVWTQSPTSYRYRWESCEPLGYSCVVVQAGDSDTYVVDPSDRGHTIRVLVTASNSYGDGEPAMSAPTAVGGPLIVIVRPTAPVAGGSVRLAVACLGGEPGQTCRGTLQLRLTRRHRGRKRHRRLVVLRRRKISMRTGARRRVALHLNRVARALIGVRRGVRAQAVAVTRRNRPMKRTVVLRKRGRARRATPRALRGWQGRPQSPLRRPRRQSQS